MTPIPITHADHDLLDVAAYAAGDATGAELDGAMALVAACPECAALHHDLRSIAAALPALPDPVRSRDFRLTPEQAASLRPAGWRRLLAPLAGPRFAFAGPLGTGLATLGIAGFLVAGAAGMPIAGSAAAPDSNPNPESSDLLAAMPAPSEAADASMQIEMAPVTDVPSSEGPIAQAPASQVPAGFGGGGAGTGGVNGANGTTATGPEATGTGGGGPIDTGAADPKAGDGRERMSLAAPDEDVASAQTMDAAQTAPATTPLFVLAAVMLAAGVLLGGLRLIARRAA